MKSKPETDLKADKKAGIKPGSKKDEMLDKEAAKGKKAPPFKKGGKK